MERAAELQRVTAIGEPGADIGSLPLCVDLDGTLLTIDTLPEAAVAVCLSEPRVIVALPGWLARGKARLKQELARRWGFDPAQLPYNFAFLAYLQEQKARGRLLVLATAADRCIAQKIADHLGLFDTVIASDGTSNLSGAAKAAALIERFGSKGFVYAAMRAPTLRCGARRRRPSSSTRGRHPPGRLGARSGRARGRAAGFARPRHRSGAAPLPMG